MESCLLIGIGHRSWREIGRPHMEHKHHIEPDAELIFVDNLMNIIHPHSCSVIDLSREQGYKIETKMIGE